MPRRAAPDSLTDWLLTRDERWFLDGLLSSLDELPDGAWQAACCAAIAQCGRFKSFDPHEIWLAWCVERGEELARARSTS